MFIKTLIFRLIHDALYDWYEEVKKGKESILTFIVHWGLWVGGFIFMHCFWAVILYELCTIQGLELWKFLLIVVIIMFSYFLVWYAADHFYEGDRPTIEGINDEETIHKRFPFLL